MSQQLFNPGRLVATPVALKLGECGANLISCLIRHLSGDWGDLSSEDKAENEKWAIYEKGKGCLVAFDIEVNGTPERVPVFYIAVDKDYIYASDAIDNFGIPNRWLEPQLLP